jgi:hypothetical protein
MTTIPPPADGAQVAALVVDCADPAIVADS